MQRDIFTSDHEAFRDTVRSFIAKEVTPYHDQWELDGVVSRDVWLAAGQGALESTNLPSLSGNQGWTPSLTERLLRSVVPPAFYSALVFLYGMEAYQDFP